MNNKRILLVMIMLFALLIGLSLVATLNNNSTYNMDNYNFSTLNTQDKTLLKVNQQGPIDLKEFINKIRTEEYFEGYDSQTLAWMESLGQKEVFTSNDSYIIMNRMDASKINTVFVTDAYIEEYIDCVVVENHSLGGNNPHNVLLVKDVTNLGNRTYYYEV
ncbi:MAG: hypothetical protein BZ136_05180 [Methanosphaera sp. rholeuAM74]|nr:MAG: hypothetical protein BZ136_05180 [Methanosphaera sp. rholeuAM74]